MEDKAYSLQSPDYLAKEYGGNKQKLAQAAQMGLIDPTAAVMAGMFVDRMRSAAMQEQAPPQQTVAQQVFAPPQPATPPPPPPMGGAAPPQQGAPTPQGGPPGMGAPPPPPQGGPPGMAAGGLTTLPIPDQMFGEPSGSAESFAGGGIVSFAEGGEADESEYGRGARYELTLDPLRETFANPELVEERRSDIARRKSIGAGEQAARKPTGPEGVELVRAPDRTPGAGTPAAAYKSPLNRIIDWNDKRTAGREAAYDRYAAADAARRGEAPKKPATAAPARPGTTPAATAATPDKNNNGRVYRPTAAGVRPASSEASGSGSGSGSGSYRVSGSSRGASASPAGIASLPAAQTAAALPPAKTLQDTLSDVEKMQGDVSQGAAFKEQQAALAALRSPEGQKARKKEDLWASLAEIGFGIASGQSSNALSNISAGFAAALPGINSRNKERRTEQREALKDAVNAELAVYGMKVNSVKTAAELYKTAQELNLKGIEMRDALKMAADRNAVAREGNQLQYKASMASVGASERNSIRASGDSRRALTEAQDAAIWEKAYKQASGELENVRIDRKAPAGTREAQIDARAQGIYSRMRGGVGASNSSVVIDYGSLPK